MRLLLFGESIFGSRSCFGTRYLFWTESAWWMMHFKSCIRCLRVGWHVDEALADLVMDGNFFASALPLLDFAREPASVVDERLAEEGAD